MAKPYSYDLRQKVIQAIQLDGMRKNEASLIFSISRNTIDLWLKRQAETGDYQAKPRPSRGRKCKITNWEKFRAFALAHGDKTQAQMAQLWESPISVRSISRALQKIDFTRKKDLWVPRTGCSQTPSVLGAGVRQISAECGLYR